MSMDMWRRQLIVWELYDGTLVEMYINPQNISFQHTKKISSNRTKGGFSVQYWGDDLDIIQLSGTTGSSGIEGIEMLYDVYRSEQLKASRLNDLDSYKRYAYPTHGRANLETEDKASEQAKLRTSDLVSRATQVVMWYGSKRYYGFFNNFNVQEAASSPGEYTYTMGYTVWRTIGRDVNYMPWHRHPDKLEMPDGSRGGNATWVAGSYQLIDRGTSAEDIRQTYGNSADSLAGEITQTR